MNAAQPDLDFDFARFIGFSAKLSPLNMVPTQRTILRLRKTDAFVWAKLILKKNFLTLYEFRSTTYG